jgi:undecaprenyl-diphosphatase
LNKKEEVVTEKAKKISIQLLIVLFILIIIVAVFTFIVNHIVWGKNSDLDIWAFERLSNITNVSTTNLMVTITFFGSSYFLLPAYTFLIVYFLTFGKNKKLALYIAVVGVTSRLIQTFLKSYFQRHRPPDPLIENVDGFSFPSGHSFSGFTFFGLLIYIIWKHDINIYIKWIVSLFLFLFAATIAFSRVYLHVHYVSDVIAGFCLSLTWFSICIWLLDKFTAKYKR